MQRKQGWDGRKKAEEYSRSRVAAVAKREVCTRCYVRPTGLHGALLILETKIDYS